MLFRSRVFDAAVLFVWTAVPGPAGVVYLGTGNDGKVFRVDAGGRGALFYDAPELQVHAVLPRPDGSVLVGTSPDGRVYRVDAAGTAREFFDPEEKYIWALAADTAGRIYVATGDPKGRLRTDARGVRFVEVVVNGPKTWSIAAAVHPDLAAAYDAAQQRAAVEIIG